MRYLEPFVRQDLLKKMVFVGGPRQSGKTTLALSLLEDEKSTGTGRYFNWDADEDRRLLLAKQWDAKDSFLLFDEIHKYPRWKNWLKGIYDKKNKQQKILVTGSARLDVYRRGGDSMLGRYHYWRLHPFCLGELPKGISADEGLKRLMQVGGFPEPFLDNDETAARRWRKSRFERILRDDIRDLEPLRDLATLSLFVDMLRSRVGGAVVLSNMATDLQVAPKTLKHWLEVLEKMYLIFIVRPYTENISRAVLKAPKVYFYDNLDVIGDKGAVFENLVATHLHKRLNFHEDRDGYRYGLHYVRDRQGREVDFAVTKEGKLTALIEAKWADTKVSKSLLYHANRLQASSVQQIVGTLDHSFTADNVGVVTPARAFAKLDGE
jgi:predicted AAA+ superfamily ATPase